MQNEKRYLRGHAAQSRRGPPTGTGTGMESLTSTETDLI